MPVIAKAATLSTKEAEAYVGNRALFTELRKAYPKILTPIRTVHSGEDRKPRHQWLVETIDRVLTTAQHEGPLRTKTKP